MKQDLKSMTLAEMQDAFAAIGEPKFRAKQVFTWLHRGAVSFDAMTNLSKPLREKLDGLYYITAPSVARKQVSKLDGTIKYLWKLRDGNCVESVVMQYHHGNTVCISSEVGCLMGCKFCASTIGGLVRRLEPSELVDQVLFSQLDSGLPISNIVLMGIGEPLDNFANVMRFLELINSPDGMNIGMRHIPRGDQHRGQRCKQCAALPDLFYHFDSFSHQNSPDRSRGCSRIGLLISSDRSSSHTHRHPGGCNRERWLLPVQRSNTT